MIFEMRDVVVRLKNILVGAAGDMFLRSVIATLYQTRSVVIA